MHVSEKHIGTSLMALFLAVVLSVALVPAQAFADLTAGSPSYSLEAQAQTKAEVNLQDVKWFANAPNMTHKGIDVSEWQEDIDWQAVAKTDVEYAIIRSSFGVEDTRLDKKWLQNVEGAQSINMPFGVYHFAYGETVKEAESEGKQVLYALTEANLSPSAIQFPIYYDMELEEYKKKDEKSRKLHADMFNAFKKVLNDAGYTKVGMYSSAAWYLDFFNKTEVEPDYIWMASWPVGTKVDPNTFDPYYYAPDDFRTIGIGLWQYATTRVNGIKGVVDTNLCRNDLSFYSQKGSVINMYRLYNKWTGEHLFTASVDECADLEKRGWRYEGVAWRSPKESTNKVYRLYNPWSGDHHYTTSKKEYDKCKRDGWRGEGTAWFSAPSTEMPVYRLFNPYEQIGFHHYTTSKVEYDRLVKKGWRGEDVGWHGLM